MVCNLLSTSSNYCFSSFKMSEKLIIKYFPENEFAKEPFYAPEDAAGLCL